MNDKINIKLEQLFSMKGSPIQSTIAPSFPSASSTPPSTIFANNGIPSPFSVPSVSPLHPQMAMPIPQIPYSSMINLNPTAPLMMNNGIVNPSVLPGMAMANQYRTPTHLSPSSPHLMLNAATSANLMNYLQHQAVAYAQHAQIAQMMGQTSPQTMNETTMSQSYNLLHQHISSTSPHTQTMATHIPKLTPNKVMQPHQTTSSRSSSVHTSVDDSSVLSQQSNIALTQSPGPISKMEFVHSIQQSEGQKQQQESPLNKIDQHMALLQSLMQSTRLNYNTSAIINGNEHENDAEKSLSINGNSPLHLKSNQNQTRTDERSRNSNNNKSEQQVSQSPMAKNILNNLFASMRAHEEKLQLHANPQQNCSNSPPNSIANSILASISDPIVDDSELINSVNKELGSHLTNNSSMEEQYKDIDISGLQISSDILDDLATRFVLNMPTEEKDDPIRICFQIEIAFWFYTDFYCEMFSNLPRLKLKRFAYIMFTYIPRLRRFLDVFDQVITSWIDYKFSIPCSGAVLLDKTLEYVLLVQGYGSKNWSFPKGKVNHDETLMNCAIREVSEETGYDCTDKISESVYIERKIFESTCRLFLVPDVEMDYQFYPHVRNEIYNIQWFQVSELPMRPQKKNSGNNGQTSANFATKFFTIYPFVYSIRKWIEKERKRRRKESKRVRRRTVSSSACGSESEGARVGHTDGSSSEKGSIDEPQSNSNSPYMMIETGSVEIGNESTSFIDAKLDDIYNSYSSTSNIFKGESSRELSLQGVEVFNAELEPKIHRENNSNHQLNNWPRTWQTLVNEYNRRNSINTPIGYDLMATPKNDCNSRDHKNDTLLENNNDRTLGTIFGSKELSCDDKLNFLFRFAESNQLSMSKQSPKLNNGNDTQQSNNNHSHSTTSNNRSKFGQVYNCTSIGSKKSPFGAIGSKQTKPTNDLNEQSTKQETTLSQYSLLNYTPLKDDSTSASCLFQKLSNKKMSDEVILDPKTSSDSSESFLSDKQDGHMLLNKLMTNMKKQTTISNGNVFHIPPTQSVNGMSTNSSSQSDDSSMILDDPAICYNGFDPKNVPFVEDKIFKLIERLKIISD
ncbi:mRNA-decapping enzyme subunit 2 [Blomia tropicalis]|nr:mRNA-decapping enzyme subunit 2 [Blomia tropicalis]